VGKLPVHHDGEYRVRLEKEELLRRLGIGMLPDEYRETVLQSNSDNDDHDREGRRTGFVDEGIGTNMAALLRSVVLQNELVLAALKRLEEAMSARPRPFNPADWK